VDLHSAIVRSCDVYFYNVGQRLGIDRISYFASSLGLGRRTGIDLPSEATGIVPSEEWVQRVYHHKWYAGETISIAIGQGALTVTPVQEARMVAAVASGGMLAQPHLLKDAANAKPDSFPISDDTVEQVTQALYGVVNEGGTGGALKLQNIEFCGKTGTAQLMSLEKNSSLGLGKGKNSGWFVGFAPRRNPEIVVAALVQNTKLFGAETAGPVVRDIVKAYYDKKSGHLPQPTTAENIPPAEARPRLAANTGVQQP